jgi:Arc/MetJ family transcription regulator
MPKTILHLDEELLEQAREILGTSSASETIHVASLPEKDARRYSIGCGLRTEST